MGGRQLHHRNYIARNVKNAPSVHYAHSSGALHPA